MVKLISIFKGTDEMELGVFDSQKDALLAIANDIEWEEGDDPHDYVFRIEECDEDYEEPADIDDDCGFDPYCGCYTYDCQGGSNYERFIKSSRLVFCYQLQYLQSHLDRACILLVGNRNNCFNNFNFNG